MVIPIEHPSLLHAHIRLKDIARLRPNWDSYDALPPSPQAIAGAGFLIEAVAEDEERRTGDRVAPWMVAPLSDGGV